MSLVLTETGSQLRLAFYFDENLGGGIINITFSTEKYVLLSKDLQKSSLNVNNLKGLRDFVKRLKLLETRM